MKGFVFAVSLALCAIHGLTSCVDGVPLISHSGECDGYTDWETSPYRLPWTVGETHEISQGNCGGATHVGSSRYAYDMVMDINTDVLAVRAGVVIKVKEDGKDSDGNFGEANYVKVQHDDGTIAAYGHLTENGVLVDVGAVVTQGQVIARSGKTGTAGPHLHFEVQTSDEKDTVPVTFSNTRANARGLIRGKSYTAL
jgi:murein DD-endopeptidase MepM/ murein hydrolase activator NlpD